MTDTLISGFIVRHPTVHQAFFYGRFLWRTGDLKFNLAIYINK